MAKGLNSYIRKRDELLIRQINHCMYCLSNERPLAIDHIIPPKDGGDSTLENLTRACNKCNGMKTDLFIGKFFNRTVEKREQIANKLYTYTGRLKRYRKRGTSQDYEKEYSEKIKELLKTHTYYSTIINSIHTGKYRPNLMKEVLNG